MADGRLNACKPCVKVSASKWNRDNLPARRNIQNTYLATHPLDIMKARFANPKQVPEWYSELDELAWIEACDLSRLRFESTGVRHEIDHIVPLKGRTVSGLHWHANWRVVEQGINQRKHATYH